MLLEKIKNKKIILASQSPRRKQIMQDAGFNIIVKTKDGIDETIPENISAKDVAEYLAKMKAEHFVEELKNDEILITADTIVCLDDEILGKPQNYEHALEILQKLSDKKHQVITGVCIIFDNKEISFSETTQVYFKKLKKEEIIYYIEKYKPYDKAGAYGIQEWIGYTSIEKIEGSYFNVVGLPIQKIYKNLEQIFK